MHSLRSVCLDNQLITHGLLKTVRLIGEYKGREAQFKQQSPQILEVLKRTAIAHSIKSSNRLEGITVTEGRLKDLLIKPNPQTRSEQEVAGYRAALISIHNDWEKTPFTPNVILQLHKNLYQHAAETGGKWKNQDNIIANHYLDGRVESLSQPVSADEISGAMHTLHDLFNDAWEKNTHDRLLLIPSYVLDFLCIQPFDEGNGRMARLLSLLLLYKAGYHVGRYISLEKIVEDTKESYYDALKASSQEWYKGTHSLIPWWDYFLGVMLLAAYHEFERRVEIANKSGAKRELVEKIIIGLPRIFKVADIEQQATGISRPTINRALAKLQSEDKIRKVSRGRDASWENWLS